MHVAKMDDGIGRSLLLPREWHLSPLALAKRVLLAPRPVSLSNDATLRARARDIVMDCIRIIDGGGLVDSERPCLESKRALEYFAFNLWSEPEFMKLGKLESPSRS